MFECHLCIDSLYVSPKFILALDLFLRGQTHTYDCLLDKSAGGPTSLKPSLSKVSLDKSAGVRPTHPYPCVVFSVPLKLQGDSDQFLDFKLM